MSAYLIKTKDHGKLLTGGKRWSATCERQGGGGKTGYGRADSEPGAIKRAVNAHLRKAGTT